MSINVNPPPQLRIPQAFLQDREVRTFIEQQNTIIFQLYQRTGGANDGIDDNAQALADAATYSGFGVQVQFLQQQIDGLPEFTMDTEGFTMDSTEWTMDKVLA